MPEPTEGPDDGEQYIPPTCAETAADAKDAAADESPIGTCRNNNAETTDTLECGGADTTLLVG